MSPLLRLVLPGTPSAGRRPRRRRPPLLLLGVACGSLVLGACGREEAPEVDLPEPAAAPEEADQSAAPVSPEVAGFIPLPSATQVLAAIPIGRADPFASDRPVVIPSPAGPGSAVRPTPLPPPPPLELPEDFRFSGVIRTGARAQAIVQLGDNTGALAPGEVGGRNTDLIPIGWVVSSIDVDRGRLVLRQGNQTVTAEL